MAKILWVDDDIEFSLDAYLDEFRLANPPVEIVPAKDPVEMWEMLRKHGAGVTGIIMDSMMPTMGIVDVSESEKGTLTGCLLIDKIRESTHYKHIPVLVLSILMSTEVIKWSNERGVLLLWKQAAEPEIVYEEAKNAGMLS